MNAIPRRDPDQVPVRRQSEEHRAPDIVDYRSDGVEERIVRLDLGGDPGERPDDGSREQAELVTSGMTLVDIPDMHDDRRHPRATPRANATSMIMNIGDHRTSIFGSDVVDRHQSCERDDRRVAVLSEAWAIAETTKHSRGKWTFPSRPLFPSTADDAAVHEFAKNASR